MPVEFDALQNVTLWEVAAAIVAVGAVVAGINRWVMPPLRAAARALEALHDFRDALYGLPEDLDASGAVIRAAQPGLLARVKSIEYHVQPNHGESAWDAMKKGQDEMRDLVVDAIAEIGELRRDYEKALRVNHPGYNPAEFAD